MRGMIIAATALLASCATTTPEPRLKQWLAIRSTDKFTDQASCMVQSLDQARAAIFVTRPSYYPYVEKRGSDIRVGIISGGRFRLPVGRVQLRVDANDTWTIETAETPTDLAAVNADQLAQSMTAASPKISAEAREIYARSATAVTNTLNQAMSPYTSATGDKARRILAQMRGGSEVIYRTLAANQAGSTEGRMILGPEFQRALAECGL